MSIAKISYIAKNSPLFAPRLINITDPPDGLFVQGNATLLKEPRILAVVGTRKCSAYGLAAAAKLISELAGCQIVIVSGLARGIDAAAHQAALNSNCKTIAVMGAGLNHIYPAEHKRLAQQILEQDGLLISEFKPEIEPRDWQFVKRNRLIAGLSLATLIIEAPLGSGALLTADYALGYNRELLCLPGQITSQQSAGPNQLISQGARIITSSEDILETFGITKTKTTAKQTRNNFTPVQKTIIKMLSVEPLNLSQIAEQSGLAMTELTVAITELELASQICWHSNETYSVK